MAEAHPVEDELDDLEASREVVEGNLVSEVNPLGDEEIVGTVGAGTESVELTVTPETVGAGTESVGLTVTPETVGAGTGSLTVTPETVAAGAESVDLTVTPETVVAGTVTSGTVASESVTGSTTGSDIRLMIKITEGRRWS